jgi:glutathione peroxidase
MPDTRARRGGDGALDRANAAAAAVPAAAVAATTTPPALSPTLAQLQVTDVQGQTHALSDFVREGTKALLIFNSASACGYTKKNWEGLAALHSRHASQGLQILAFPSDSFKQEPLEGPKLESWARDTYGTTFPVLGKAPVVGPEAQPVFRFLREQAAAAAAGSSGGEPTNGQAQAKEVVTWNFWKFLVDPRTGRVVKTYDMPYRADGVERDVQAMLGAPSAEAEGRGDSGDAAPAAARRATETN